MQSRNPEFIFSPNFNFATESLTGYVTVNGAVTPVPPENDFLLLDGSFFLLLNGTNFLLL